MGRTAGLAGGEVSVVRFPSAHSEGFKTLHRAILERRQITCTYDRYDREACPHVLGHTKGEEKVLVYHFAGGSNLGLDPGGQWRCLAVDGIRGLKMREGRWHTGSGHSQRATCVENVYVDVNTAVPNQPGRR
jgi:hypothetical protein